MSRLTRFFALSFVIALLTAFGFSANIQAPAFAQEEEEMMTHTCDSTLILLLFIAEYEYGFHSEMMDLSTFDKGQYAPWFDMMMAEMEMMEEDDMMDMDMTEEAMMEDDDMMMDDMMMLAPGHIEGEDEACTALREEIETYLYETISADMMMMMEESEG